LGDSYVNPERNFAKECGWPADAV